MTELLKLSFSRRLSVGANRLFGEDKVHIHLLAAKHSDKLMPAKDNIASALETLQSIKPEDILIVYLSGHGVNWGGQDGDFYYLTKSQPNIPSFHYSIHIVPVLMLFCNLKDS